uniref:Uncharacterized protein n=1 Tax=Glossina brevipalpis TaxID=37001 RepID=A0A1A9WYJ1_9MUSC
MNLIFRKVDEMDFYIVSQLDLPHLWYTLISGHPIQTTQSDATLRQQHPIEFYHRPNTHVINEFEDSEEQINPEITTLDVSERSVQLVDLSTSPPRESLTFANQPEVLRRIPNSIASTPPSTQRSSLFSQYSRSSSSDDCSLSFSTSGGGNFISHSNNFDDGAENFVINFPADTASLPSYKKNDCIINLPLSETEPLLTNIEATVNDSERSIYLHKNSSSLVFTKKELPNTLTSSTSSFTNNNLRRTSLAAITANHKSSAFPLAQLRRNHSSLRSSSEENHKRKPTKHLPASYQQLQRRSLQLNYNNNLITTSTCAVHHNNNQCCGGNTTSNSAVLHKLQQSNRTKQHTTNVKPSTDAVGTTITSAGATRRQYSYSWYAPVYSALEEELEQDSRDSSPIHNLANPKKKQISNYHQQKTVTTRVNDNDTEVLLETHNHNNIQAQLQTANGKKNSGSIQAPAKLTLPLQHSLNSTFKGRQPRTESIGSAERGEFGSVPKLGSYETEGPHAGSLGLAGGPQPRRIRFGNFLKSLVGLRPSVNNVLVQSPEHYNTGNTASNGGVPNKPMPSSPEITITRTPSEQNVVVLRNPSASHSSKEKLANGGSSTSLNVMQQKLWNMIKRDGSSNSLNHEKSQSIVQYTNLRKCETVLALTRQTNSLCSPTLGMGSSSSGYHLSESNYQAPYTGSGIFSANGVEQIRPLNRLRTSTFSMNATCSRCSSLLSMAASGSRYSLNATPGSITHLRNPSILSSSNLSSNYSRNGDNNPDNCLSIATKSNSRINFCAGRKTFDSGANNIISSRTSSVTSPTTTITTTASTTKLTSPPTDQTLAVSAFTASPREVVHTTATLLGLAKPTTTTEQTVVKSAISDDVIDGVSNNNAGNIVSAYASLTSLHASFHSDSSSALASVAKSNAITNNRGVELMKDMFSHVGFLIIIKTRPGIPVT